MKHSSASAPNPQSRRTFLRSALVVAGAVTWSGLGGCARRSQVPRARVTLTQWYHQYGEAGTQAAVMRYAQQYTAKYPDVAINVVWVPGDYGTKLNTALLVAGGPDVFERAGLQVPMVSAGQVAPLDDLFTPDVRQSFDASDLTSNSVDGRIYAVKMVTDTGLIYYRKSLLQKAGLAPPRTLDELLAASKALVAPRRKGLFLGNDAGVGAALYLAPWSAGEAMMRDDKIAFNTPRVARSLEKLGALANSPSLLVGAPTDWWDPSALIQGLCAMQWGGLWSYPAIEKELGGDIGALAWPALDAEGEPSTFLGGWSQMVNARSPHVEEAKKYVRFLWIENREIQRDWNLSYGFHVPPRTDVVRSSRALAAPVPALAVENLRRYGHVLPPAWSGGMNTAFSDAAINIIKTGRPARAQIAAAAAKCQRELERLFRFRN